MLLISLLLMMDGHAEQAPFASPAAPPQKGCNPAADINQFGKLELFIPEIVACGYAGDFSSALKLVSDARRFTASTPDRRDDYRAILAHASVLQFMGLYNEAIALYQTVAEASEDTSPALLAQVENNMAWLYMTLGQYKEARRLVESAITRRRELNDSVNEGYAQSTLAAILVAMKVSNDAKLAIETCLRIAQQHDITSMQVYCGRTLAEWYALEGDHAQALTTADATIALAESRKLYSDMADTYLSKAKALLALQRASEALYTANQGVAIAVQQNDQESALPLWRFIESLHASKKNWAEAYRAKQRTEQITQELFDQKLTYALASQRVQRETAEKEQEIVLLRKENQLHQAEVEIANAQRHLTIFVSLVSVAIAWLLLSRWIQKRDLQRAHATNEELRRLHDLKDEILENTSHELRTPLNGIVSMSELLLAEFGSELHPDIIEQMTLIRDCGTKLEEMVTAILDFSQIRAGKSHCALTTTDLSIVMARSVQLLAPLARSKGLSLLCEQIGPLPTVYADADRIQQVLINLIGNAIKFTERGQITVRAEHLDQQVLVQVIDTGIGIPPDKLDIIFEPFEQVDGCMRRRHSGVGLGLAIAREIARAHGSELQVASQLGHGSTFSFRLPINNEAKSPA